MFIERRWRQGRRASQPSASGWSPSCRVPHDPRTYPRCLVQGPRVSRRRTDPFRRSARRRAARRRCRARRDTSHTFPSRRSAARRAAPRAAAGRARRRRARGSVRRAFVGPALMTGARMPALQRARDDSAAQRAWPAAPASRSFTCRTNNETAPSSRDSPPEQNELRVARRARESGQHGLGFRAHAGAAARRRCAARRTRRSCRTSSPPPPPRRSTRG